MSTSLRLRLAAGALVAASGLAVLSAGTADATHRLPETINGHAASLHPEGIAFDPTRQAFLVGSVRHGTVSVVAPDGHTTTLVDDPRMASSVGLTVDTARNRILVAFADIGVSARSNPDPAARRTGLGIFNLRTGAAEHVVDLGDGTHLINDVTFDRAGNAYVTDSFADAVYRVDPAGHASVLVRDPRFVAGTAGAPGINGIVWRNGYLIVGKYDTGTLFRVTTTGTPRVDEVRLDRPLVGVDGLTLRGDGTLLAVTNTLSAPAATDAVTVLRLRDNGFAAQERSSTPWPVPDPSTIAVSPFGSYAVSGNLALLLGSGTTSDEFTLRRL